MNFDHLAVFTAILSTVEIGLGSLLHGLKLPFSGHFLSLNQIFILTLLNRQQAGKNGPALVSSCSALLKTLAPAGKKLTPMLAITMQGQLYTWGLYVLGENIFGRILGGILGGLWSFIQPLLLYLLIFGKGLIDVYDYFFSKLSQFTSLSEQSFITLLLGLIVIKLLLSLGVVLLAHKVTQQQFDRYQSWTKKFINPRTQKNKPSKSPLKGALSDMFQGFFLFTILLTIIFFVFAKSSYAPSIWIILRPLAMGFLVFYLLRRFPLKNTLAKMPESKYKKILSLVVEKINA
ncbi:MAG: hypothetical protein CME62_05395 [Halobacteriovoraceae bacterium]|nr:hypothetical protein [Halobacteriovoraceae bacterium]|tara:strand:- start:18956 stop:19825 length:870 start_codon:yes stop_codon:yes gene_type:complete